MVVFFGDAKHLASAWIDKGQPPWRPSYSELFWCWRWGTLRCTVSPQRYVRREIFWLSAFGPRAIDPLAGVVHLYLRQLSASTRPGRLA
jgi:hypothetical protein